MRCVAASLNLNANRLEPEELQLRLDYDSFIQSSSLLQEEIQARSVL